VPQVSQIMSLLLCLDGKITRRCLDVKIDWSEVE